MRDLDSKRQESVEISRENEAGAFLSALTRIVLDRKLAKRALQAPVEVFAEYGIQFLDAGSAIEKKRQLFSEFSGLRRLIELGARSTSTRRRPPTCTQCFETVLDDGTLWIANLLRAGRNLSQRDPRAVPQLAAIAEVKNADVDAAVNTVLNSFANPVPEHVAQELCRLRGCRGPFPPH